MSQLWLRKITFETWVVLKNNEKLYVTKEDNIWNLSGVKEQRETLCLEYKLVKYFLLSLHSSNSV